MMARTPWVMQNKATFINCASRTAATTGDYGPESSNEEDLSALLPEEHNEIPP